MNRLLSITQARAIRGNKKRHGVYTKLMEMKTALAVTGKSKNFVIVCFSSVILFAVGAFVSVLIDNLFLLLALSISLALVPFVYTANTLATYEKTTKEELETKTTLFIINRQKSLNILFRCVKLYEYYSIFLKARIHKWNLRLNVGIQWTKYANILV